MASRPTWKGFLKFALVTIPIKVFPATASSEGIAFNQLHEVCSTRLQQKKWCPTCAREVPTSEIVKGFEFEAGKYVILLPAELDAVQPPSTRVIDLVQVADAAALEPQYFDRAYYLAPDGPHAGEAYAVLREALQGKLAIGKLGIYGREYLVAVRPQLYTLLLFTLHHEAEIRPLEEIDALGDIATHVSPTQVKLARQIVAALTAPLDLSDYSDAYQADVQRVIDAKIAGEEIVIPPLETPTVLQFAEALRRSLSAVGARPTPAKASPVRKRKRA